MFFVQYIVKFKLCFEYVFVFFSQYERGNIIKFINFCVIFLLNLAVPLSNEIINFLFEVCFDKCDITLIIVMDIHGFSFR